MVDRRILFIAQDDRQIVGGKADIGVGAGAVERDRLLQVARGADALIIEITELRLRDRQSGIGRDCDLGKRSCRIVLVVKRAAELVVEARRGIGSDRFPAGCDRGLEFDRARGDTGNAGGLLRVARMCGKLVAAQCRRLGMGQRRGGQEKRCGEDQQAVRQHRKTSRVRMMCLHPRASGTRLLFPWEQGAGLRRSCRSPPDRCPAVAAGSICRAPHRRGSRQRKSRFGCGGRSALSAPP